ncbi:imm11 family protein [Campylobacter jejuni]|uniref:imm11 family protein n=1 Tax=Campylobacter jejuni TaxID=197 RepID=UPI0039647476
MTNWQTPSFEIDKDDGKILTDLISNVYNWRIVSPKFINLMQDLIKDCVQYLDVEIKSQEINYYDCKIMHVIKSLEALDYEHSVYTYMGDNNEYHEYILEKMSKIDKIARGDKNKFLKEFEKLKEEVKNNPAILHKDYYKERK